MPAFDWAGSTIQQQSVIPTKRFVIGAPDEPIATDLREWITPADSQVLKQVIDSLKLPKEKKPGSFDERARWVWEYVIKRIHYVEDMREQTQPDFWQFPAETIVRKRGDCEDCAVLLASLLIAAGISPFCVRVVLGTVKERRESCFHAWPIYKDESGVWRILEATLDVVPSEWPSADALARPRASPRYEPAMCFNQHHVWSVGLAPLTDAGQYLTKHLAAGRVKSSALIERLRHHFA
jgi:hypothetical protein